MLFRIPTYLIGLIEEAKQIGLFIMDPCATYRAVCQYMLRIGNWWVRESIRQKGDG